MLLRAQCLDDLKFCRFWIPFSWTENSPEKWCLRRSFILSSFLECFPDPPDFVVVFSCRATFCSTCATRNFHVLPSVGCLVLPHPQKKIWVWFGQKWDVHRRGFSAAHIWWVLGVSVTFGVFWVLCGLKCVFPSKVVFLRFLKEIVRFWYDFLSFVKSV